MSYNSKEKLLSLLKENNFDCNFVSFHVLTLNLFYPVHGLIIDLKKLNYFKDGYALAIYSKDQDDERFLFIDDIYNDLNESLKRLTHYVNYFPLYGKSKVYDTSKIWLR